MPFVFSLCPGCRDRYGALRHDATCIYSLNVMPLCSLIWPDEHPEHWFRVCCKKCKESICRLAHARTELWHHGEIPADHLDLWDEARAIIPDWPGFKRLTLDEKQRESLRGCALELEDMMGGIAAEFPNIKLTDKGGGQVEFIAKRATAKPPTKQWWQFWK